MRLSPAKYIARKNALDGGAATPHATESVQMPTPEKEDMTNPTPPQPVLPLEFEAELTIRHMRLIAAGLSVHADDIVRTDARLLNELADALERSHRQACYRTDTPAVLRLRVEEARE